MDEMKMMRQEKDGMIKEVLQQISGAMNDDRCNQCISEDRGTRDKAKEQVSVPQDGDED